MPPEWMSILSPKIADAMTEHSMCHPGRPGPHGEGQDGSPGFDAFHNAKSAAERRALPAERAPRDQSAEVQRDMEDDIGRRTFAFFKQFPVPFAPRLKFSVIVTF